MQRTLQLSNNVGKSATRNQIKIDSKPLTTNVIQWPSYAIDFHHGREQKNREEQCDTVVSFAEGFNGDLCCQQVVSELPN